MKPVDEILSVKLPPVRLYQDDLERVIEIISRHAEDSLELRCGKFIYDSVTELKSHRSALETLHDLRISISSRLGRSDWGQIAIEFESSGVEITGRGALQDRAARVALLLSKQAPWYSWYPAKHSLSWDAVVVLLWLVAITLGGIVWTVLPQSSKLLHYSVLTLLAAVYFVPLFSGRSVYFGGTRIFLYSRQGKPTFWQKNKDDILKEAIKLLISAAVGFLLGRFTGH